MLDAQESESQTFDQAVWDRQVGRIEWSGRRLGTIVPGVDLENLTDEMFERIALGFLTHSVILIKNQRLSPEKQVELTRRFGSLKRGLHDEYMYKDIPTVTLVSNILKEGKRIGNVAIDSGWHADGSSFERPSGTLVLYALELPPAGGDTPFTDLYAAHDALPPEKQRQLEGMLASHQYHFRYGDSSKQNARKRGGGAIHPVIRTHFQTGRQSLFTGDEHSNVTALNMTPEDGKAFMRELFDFATQPQFVYTHKWEVGDVVIWDNRVTLHRATPFDMANHRRLLHRTATLSERPYFKPR